MERKANASAAENGEEKREVAANAIGTDGEDERGKASPGSGTVGPRVAEGAAGGAKGVGAYGKFGSLSSLLRAYDCLEAEFTRRSKRLRQLEREAEERDKREAPSSPQEEAAGSSLPAAGDEAEKAVRETLPDSRAEKSKLTEKDFLVAAVRNNPGAYGEIVSAYLREVTEAKPAASFGGGRSVKLPPKRPKSLAEARDMAKMYLDKKNF